MRFCGTRNSYPWEAFSAKPDFRKADSDSLCILKLLESVLYNLLNVRPWLYLQVWKMIKPCFPQINAKKTHQICTQNSRRNKIMDLMVHLKHLLSISSILDDQWVKKPSSMCGCATFWTTGGRREQCMHQLLNKQGDKQFTVWSLLGLGVFTAQRHSLQKTNTHSHTHTQILVP